MHHSIVMSFFRLSDKIRYCERKHIPADRQTAYSTRKACHRIDNIGENLFYEMTFCIHYHYLSVCTDVRMRMLYAVTLVWYGSDSVIVTQCWFGWSGRCVCVCGELCIYWFLEHLQAFGARVLFKRNVFLGRRVWLDDLCCKSNADFCITMLIRRTNCNLNDRLTHVRTFVFIMH